MQRTQGTFTMLVIVAAITAAAPVRQAGAQGWRDRLKKTVEQRAGDAVDRAGRSDRADSSATAAPAGGTATNGTTPAARPGEGAWSNYDFKPGEQPLFVDDFSQDVVGNFPRRLEFRAGSAEIVEWRGKRWLSSPNEGEIYIPLGRMLPERYTVEFDLAGAGNGMTVAFDPKQSHAHDRGSEWLEFGTWFAGLKGTDRDATSPTGYKTDEAPVHVAIQVDGEYAKVYVNERRVANVPNAKLGRSSKIYMDLNGWNDKAPRMIADLRVMAGGRPLYDALAASGRVSTHGIYFATGSDQVKPESSPTLKEIGAMLADHPDLKLTIEGHTDDVGDAAANQALSQRRAEAVRQALVTTYHVDGARLTARGMGATKPAAPNTTAEGRQTNRRVELVRS